ncbi:MAG: hypothetical protein PHW79_00435 [Candidatus Marinimicrobia bacterium]|nr:hypothetical protein [Candidatus Neomarinimicrobiota bacterium]
MRILFRVRNQWKIGWFITINMGMLVTSSCMNYGTFHTADVLDKNQSSITGAYSHVKNYADKDHTEIDFYSMMARYGLGGNFDAGITFAFAKPFSSVLTTDGKYQFLHDSLKLAVDFGLTYSGLFLMPESRGSLIFQPALIGGYKRFYLGYKYNRWILLTNIADEPIVSYSTFFAGFSFGQNLRIIPEISLHYNPKYLPKPILSVGIGICYQPPAGTKVD